MAELPPQSARELARLLDASRPQPDLTAAIQRCACTGELRAGLFLINGDWVQAHVVSQELSSPLAAHWHALVHRHEPDFPNSKYWLRKVGDSPIYPRLAELAGDPAGAAGVVTDGRWEPYLFTDQFAAGNPGDWTRQTDQMEMQLLLEYCLSREES